MKAMVCPQCGASLSLDDSREFGFCSYCGAKIQINETVVHKHTGEVSLDGIATANSIAQKGFMDLARGDYEKARDTFEKAQEIEPTNTYVLFGLACATLDPDGYFINQLVAKHNEISEQEKSVINNSNALFFLKIYLYYDLPSRFDYVVKKYQIPIDLDLLNGHFKNSYIGQQYIFNLMKPHRMIDVVDLLLKNNISVDKLGVALLEKGAGENYVNSKIFSTETFEKLLKAGLSPNIEFRYRCKPYESYYDLRTLFTRQNSYKNYLELLYKYHPQEKPKGCYVATCVYGSYDCPEVWTLRRYRDNVLDKTLFGKAFITLYYAVSPKIIKLFGNTRWFKVFWKSKLDKMVKNLRSKGIESSPYNDKY